MVCGFSAFTSSAQASAELSRAPADVIVIALASVTLEERCRKLRRVNAGAWS